MTGFSLMRRLFRRSTDEERVRAFVAAGGRGMIVYQNVYEDLDEATRARLREEDDRLYAAGFTCVPQAWVRFEGGRPTAYTKGAALDVIERSSKGPS